MFVTGSISGPPPRSRVVSWLDPARMAAVGVTASDVNAALAANNYLAHAAPNGDTSATLLMKQDEKWQGLLGENLAAQHYTKEGGVTVNDFVCAARTDAIFDARPGA